MTTNNADNCPHCGADVNPDVCCLAWKCGHDALHEQRTDFCLEREEHNKTKEELDKVERTLTHTREWWATRYQTMSDWVRKNKAEIGEEFVTQYFSIIANGSATHSEPETYATLLNVKEHKINALSAKNQELCEILERAIDTLEHAEICYLVAGGKILRSELNQITK
jgi:N-acetylmuramoyl-L-alanine amidase CwlA